MPKRNIIWMAAILAAAVTAIVLSRRGPGPFVDPPPEEKFRAVAQAHRLIDEKFLDRRGDAELQRRAIEGMVKALDRFSSYVPPEMTEEFLDHVDGGRERGLGLRLEVGARGVFVTATMVDSPAHRDALAVGDQVTAIDGQELIGLSPAQVHAMLRGPAGSPVALAVRGVDGFARTAALVRGEFDLMSVTGLSRLAGGGWNYTLDAESGLAYVRIREFLKDTTCSRLAAALDKEMQNARGLLLDLRDNPGGSLEAAAEVADLFLESGLIVRTVDREGRSERIEAHKVGTLRPIPMAVLVNERTASAAEIVAGALQAHDRAVLVGAPTFGKHCVQSMFPLPQGMGYLNLTTKRFYVEEALPNAPTSRPEAPWRILPHVEAAVGARAGELARLRAAAEAVPAGIPATLPALSTANQLLELDGMLAAARQVLVEPGRADKIFQAARAARAAARLQPATRETPAP